MPKTSTDDRAWIAEAIRRVDADANRSADTHLHVLPIPVPGIELYLKDESVHPTGSLKHRLARSLFLYALCNGWIGRGSTVIEASSGSTAVSEAFFARLIGLPFVAVMPASTSPEKIALIEFYGGRCHLVDDPATMYDEARRLESECGGHYMDQFTYAERATDWRGNNNIAESIFEQMQAEPHPCPTWVVVGAGTGGTSATIGRFVRYRRFNTRVAVADPENSAFYGGWETDSSDVVDRHAVAHRGHRPDAGRALVRRRRHRRHGARAGRCVDRGDALGVGDPRAPGRWFDRHERMGVADPDRADAGGRR